jgi:hypothetical protein
MTDLDYDDFGVSDEIEDPIVALPDSVDILAARGVELC